MQPKISPTTSVPANPTGSVAQSQRSQAQMGIAGVSSVSAGPNIAARQIRTTEINELLMVDLNVVNQLGTINPDDIAK